MLLVGGISLVPHSAAAEEMLAASMEPKAGPLGTRFTFYVTGFKANEHVGVWMNAPDGSIHNPGSQDLQANPSGRADWGWRAPDGAQPGWWQMVARGEKSGYQYVFTFEVTGAGNPTTNPTPVPVEPVNPQPPMNDPRMGSVYNVDPKSGAPGTTFGFYATGFQRDEQVGIWLNAPDGSVVEIELDRVLRANRDGRADWSVDMPTGAPTGWWQLIAHGTKSGVEYAIPFELR